MWPSILNYIKIASSMFGVGNNTTVKPAQPKKHGSAVKFMESKKFFVVFSSVLLLTFFYVLSIVVLFMTVPYPTITVPFVTIFSKTVEILAIIIGVYLGIQAGVDLKYGSSSSVELSGDNSTSTETVNETIISKYEEIYKGDPSYAPLVYIENRGERHE